MPSHRAPRAGASSIASPEPQATSSTRCPSLTPSHSWTNTYSRQLLGSTIVEKSTSRRPQPSSTIFHDTGPQTRHLRRDRRRQPGLRRRRPRDRRRLHYRRLQPPAAPNPDAAVPIAANIFSTSSRLPVGPRPPNPPNIQRSDHEQHTARHQHRDADARRRDRPDEVRGHDPSVADVDRTKGFYQRLGWRLDIDFEPAPGVRGVQMTPPGSPASIQFGENTNSMQPGSSRACSSSSTTSRRPAPSDRARRRGRRGLAPRAGGPVPGLDPQRRSYFSRANFADPDGNRWVLQEITERLPGRGER